MQILRNTHLNSKTLQADVVRTCWDQGEKNMSEVSSESDLHDHVHGPLIIKYKFICASLNWPSSRINHVSGSGNDFDSIRLFYLILNFRLKCPIFSNLVNRIDSCHPCQHFNCLQNEGDTTLWRIENFYKG